jgi:hypothetical protein
VRRLIAIATPIAGLCLFTWAQTFFSAAAIVAVPACTTVDAAPLGEITGIEVLGDTLTAGYGCGPGPTQIYKYISVVTVPAATDGVDADVTRGTPGQYLAGASTDCFANATFIDLCTYDTDQVALNANEYVVTVYAFTQDQWNLVAEDAGAGSASRDGSADASDSGAPPAADASSDAPSDDGSTIDGASADAGDAAPLDAQVADAGDAAPAPPTPPPVPVSGLELTNDINDDNTSTIAITTSTNASKGTTNECVSNEPLPHPIGTLMTNLAASAGWVTHCTATQQSDIPVLARCEPLSRLR